MVIKRIEYKTKIMRRWSHGYMEGTYYPSNQNNLSPSPPFFITSPTSHLHLNYVYKLQTSLLTFISFSVWLLLPVKDTYTNPIVLLRKASREKSTTWKKNSFVTFCSFYHVSAREKSTLDGGDVNHQMTQAKIHNVSNDRVQGVWHGYQNLDPDQRFYDLTIQN